MNTAPLPLSFSETATSTVVVILPGGEQPQEVLPGPLFSTPEPQPQPFPLSLLAAQRNITEAIPNIIDGTRLSEKDSDDKEATTSETDTPDDVLQQLLEGLLVVSAQPKVETDQHVEPIAPGKESLMLVATPQEPAKPAKPAEPAPRISPSAEVKRTPLFSLQLSPQPAATGENVSLSVPQTSGDIKVSGGETAVQQPATIRLKGDESRWAQQLQSALGERLQVQVKDQIQHATIRLDPPEMGKIDISVIIENGRMQVTIHSSSAEIGRVLQQGSNELRQNLTEQNFVQVNVQVSSQNHPREGRQSRPHSQTLPEILSGVELDAQAHHEDSSVLLTV